MKIDLHVHTHYSKCAPHMTPENAVRQGIKAGLDGLVFTDHNIQMPHSEVHALRYKYPDFRIFLGVEISVSKVDHCIVIGCSLPKINYPKPTSYRAVWKQVRDSGGVLILTHPYRYKRAIPYDIREYPPDALEMYSKNICVEDQLLILDTAARIGSCVVAGSDAHTHALVGCGYTEFHEESVKTEADVVRELRAGRVAARAGKRMKKAKPSRMRKNGKSPVVEVIQ